MLVKEEEQEGYRREFRHFATQYASAISQFEVDNGQWVGRLLRVYSNFEAPNGKNFGMKEEPLPLSKFSDDEAIRAKQLEEREIADREAAAETVRFLEFLKSQKISDIAISDVKYEIDAEDPEGLHFFVTGFLDIKKSEGDVFVTGKRYEFKHRIKKTYHTKKTVIKDHGDIPGFVVPTETKTDPPTQ